VTQCHIAHGSKKLLDKPPFLCYIILMKNENRKPLIMPNGLVVESVRGNGAWMRDEIAIMEGRKSFTPDKTTAKGPVNLGPDGNSVLPKNRL